LISFLINTYEGDWPYALQLLRQVRRVYPKAAIALLCDGFCNKEIFLTCQELDGILHIGHRVKTEVSHAWSDRLFSVASTLPGVILKIDADMWINRPLELPDGDWDICCDNHIGSPVIGGCIAFSPAVVPRLQAFLEHCPVETYKELTEPQYCQDKMLRRAINELNLNVLSLPDAKINWLDPVEDPRQYAVFGPRVETIKLTGQRCKLITFRKSK
jgi:hypothetical protein